MFFSAEITSKNGPESECDSVTGQEGSHEGRGVTYSSEGAAFCDPLDELVRHFLSFFLL